jgi:phage terminase small subunit
VAAKKNPLSDKAYEIYKQGKKLVDIATELGVPPGTVRRWKSTYGWDSERSELKSERSDKKRAEKKPVVDDGTKGTLQNNDLTPEQQMFCIYYSRTFNAAQSYQKAYGCSYQTAMVNGCLLLRNTKVRAEIERLKELKRQQIVTGTEDIVELQMRIAFADIGNYLSFGQKEITDPDTDETYMISTVDLRESKDTDTQLIQEVKRGKDGVSVKLADKQKAIDWLTKYFLMHPESKYKAEYERKRAEVKDNAGEEILKNMQTIADILKNPVANRRIEDFEEKADE